MAANAAAEAAAAADAYAASAACSVAIVPFAATGSAADLQAIADERMRKDRSIRFPEASKVGEVQLRQLPGTALGAYAWSAGVELVLYLEQRFGQRLCDLSVLELGSGTGITAIALAKLGARVYGSDCIPELVKLARKNVSSNGLSTEQCSIHLYQWGAAMPLAWQRHFDLIVASEVTAIESGHDGLLSTLLSVSGGPRASDDVSAPQIFLAETRRNTQQPQFWERAQQHFSCIEASAIAQSDAWNTLGKDEPVRIFQLDLLTRLETDIVSLKQHADEPPRSSEPKTPELDSTFVAATASAPPGQDYEEVFHKEEKLDAYTMCFADLAVFKEVGYSDIEIGKLATYGSVLHSGVPLLFQGIADLAYGGSLAAAVDGKTFLDLGSAEGRCVISSALHFGITSAGIPRLRKAIGVELSTARHGLAVKYRGRLSNPEIQSMVHLVQDDIMSTQTGNLLTEADIVYAANLRFPEHVNRQLGAHIVASLSTARDCFVLDLAPLDFTHRKPAASRHVLVPMNWNPSGWPVHIHYFPKVGRF